MLIQELIEKIRGTEKDRAAVVSLIYQDSSLKKSIKSYVLNHYGNEDDVIIIFDDMIVQFIKSVFSKPDFKLEGELSAYLMGIAKHLWFAESKKRMKMKQWDSIENKDFVDQDTISIDQILSDEKKTLLLNVLSHIGKNCKEVLMYWANGYAMDEIAQKLNYKSEGMVRKKKSVCLKELTTIIQLRPEIKKALSS
ncbi:MAG: hypothetical protein V9E90_08590 [Saprospiraceae bacterium]